jgi:hypothetical protein
MELGFCLCEYLVELRCIGRAGNCVRVPQGRVHGEIKDRIQSIGALPFGNWAEPYVNYIHPLGTVDGTYSTSAPPKTSPMQKTPAFLQKGGQKLF